jgi:hypothetical protein
MKIIVLFFSLLLIGAAAYQPHRRAAFNVSSGGGSPAVESFGSTNNTFVLTFFHTNIITCSGSSRMLFVTAGSGESPVDMATNATYNGVTMTRAWMTNDANWVSISGFYLVNPSSGANPLVVTFADNEIDQMYIAWSNVTNVNQTIPVGTAVSTAGSGSAPSVTLVGATGDLMIASCATDSGGQLNATTGAIVTKTLNVGSDTAFGISTNAGGASVAMTFSTTADGYAIGGVAIKKP